MKPLGVDALKAPLRPKVNAYASCQPYCEHIKGAPGLVIVHLVHLWLHFLGSGYPYALPLWEAYRGELMKLAKTKHAILFQCRTGYRSCEYTLYCLAPFGHICVYVCMDGCVF